MVLKTGTELHKQATAIAAEFNDWRISRDNIMQVLRLMERTNGRVGFALAAKFCHIVQSDSGDPNETWWMDYSHLDEGLKEMLVLCQENMDRTQEALNKLLKNYSIGVGVMSVMNDLIRHLPKVKNQTESSPKKKKKEKKKRIIGFLPRNEAKSVKRLVLVSRPQGEGT